MCDVLTREFSFIPVHAELIEHFGASAGRPAAPHAPLPWTIAAPGGMNTASSVT